ncbi:MAG: putative Lactoylglutathione lyase [Candidatus Thorarchaeota archaeon]|nr:MAG: putative Lactoylglutathione lyase [Candidatus Thorarchaeota archaeon]
MKIVYSGIYINTTNMERLVQFYDKILSKEVSRGYETRWAEFDSFGIMNLEYDFDRMDQDEFKTHVDQAYLNFLTSWQHENKAKVVIVFETDDIKAAYLHIRETASPSEMTDIMMVYFSVKYTFFQFLDPEGNLVEVFQFD